MLITILFYIGIIAESMSCAVAAGRYKVDLFGVFFISFVAALGGGSIRDVLFNHYPLAWVENPNYVIVVIISAFIATRIIGFIQRLKFFFLTLDALGLAVFSVIGAKIVIGMGYGLTHAIIAAMITGSLGGVLRDLFCNTIPLIFQKELYAVVAMACGAIYWFAYPYLGEDIATMVTILIGFVMRMIAIKYKISLPIVTLEKENS
ncbi:trimeric intracellular cation channel family protein [Helicobacter brantae]|uniref:Glycine transporter domain-containing protein n=1 Tax=Helicobacter brantae TaxID=375927 RepID=A0A3D8J183_9HELI|nr:trimeric intracellular cation channel family protein [Helicobacter brantae]RDU70604.1 hypothetical protein CQA58_05380 [Helicobacter brantae]